jgi:hypothetical protein
MVWSNVLRDWSGMVSIVNSPVYQWMIRRFIKWEDFNVIIPLIGSDTKTHNSSSVPIDVRLHA